MMDIQQTWLAASKLASPHPSMSGSRPTGWVRFGSYAVFDCQVMAGRLSRSTLVRCTSTDQGHIHLSAARKRFPPSCLDRSSTDLRCGERTRKGPHPPCLGFRAWSRIGSRESTPEPESASVLLPNFRSRESIDVDQPDPSRRRFGDTLDEVHGCTAQGQKHGLALGDVADRRRDLE